MTAALDHRVPPFQPPYWLANPHAQSMLPASSLWRWPVWRRSARLRAASHALILEGDEVRLSAHATSQPDRQAPWVVVLHGWLGDANSTYVLSLATQLFSMGYQVLRLNLRDHGGTEHLNPGLFHSCRLNDVVSVLQRLQPQLAGDLTLAGFSLGGNFALRVAAEARNNGLRLRGVVAICPALDPHASDAALVSGMPIYHNYFMLKWKQSMLRKQRAFPDRYEFRPWLKERNLTRLTDELVRRYAGFNGVRDYYDGYSLLGDRLATVEVPCHLLLSADDPIVPVSDASRLASNAHLQLTITERGGHCGYVSGWSAPRWSDVWAANILARSA